MSPDNVDDKILWAWRYIDQGWPVFVLGRDKTPLPNCTTCSGVLDTAGARCPGRGQCICDSMYCHGFYAATTFKHRIAKMIHNRPDGMLGLRTGDGLAVLDFEGTEKGQETYDQFEAMTGGIDLPRDGLAQRTGGGGIHVILDVQANLIKSRNRVLPDMDVKSAGGYIAVGPGGDGRGWLNDGIRMGWQTVVPLASPEMIGWLVNTKGNFGGQGGAGGGSVTPGGDWYRDALVEGCPGGLRDEFFNRLVFSLRKKGFSLQRIEEESKHHWLKCQQVETGALWDMPWEHVQYKIDRTWQTVEPDEVPEWQDRYTARAQQLKQGETVVMGRRMVVRRDK